MRMSIPFRLNSSMINLAIEKCCRLFFQLFSGDQRIVNPESTDPFPSYKDLMPLIMKVANASITELRLRSIGGDGNIAGPLLFAVSMYC